MDEAALEDLTMAWFGDLGYQTAFGPDILDEQRLLREHRERQRGAKNLTAPLAHRTINPNHAHLPATIMPQRGG